MCVFSKFSRRIRVTGGLVTPAETWAPKSPGKLLHTSGKITGLDSFRDVRASGRCQTQEGVIFPSALTILGPHPLEGTATCRGPSLSCTAPSAFLSKPLRPKERGPLLCPPQSSILTGDCHSVGSGIALHPHRTLNTTRSWSRSSSHHPGRKSALVTSRYSDL